MLVLVPGYVASRLYPLSFKATLYLFLCNLLSLAFFLVEVLLTLE